MILKLCAVFFLMVAAVGVGGAAGTVEAAQPAPVVRTVEARPDRPPLERVVLKRTVNHANAWLYKRLSWGSWGWVYVEHCPTSILPPGWYCIS